MKKMGNDNKLYMLFCLNIIDRYNMVLNNAFAKYSDGFENDFLRTRNKMENLINSIAVKNTPVEVARLRCPVALPLVAFKALCHLHKIIFCIYAEQLILLDLEKTTTSEALMVVTEVTHAINVCAEAVGFKEPNEIVMLTDRLLRTLSNKTYFFQNSSRLITYTL
jgi:hypothetical protein